MTYECDPLSLFFLVVDPPVFLPSQFPFLIISEQHENNFVSFKVVESVSGLGLLLLLIKVAFEASRLEMSAAIPPMEACRTV